MDKYIIFEYWEADVIDYSQTLVTSKETLRLSVDNTLTFVNWNTEGIPLSVEALTTKSQVYTTEEIMPILDTPEWTPPLPEEFLL